MYYSSDRFEHTPDLRDPVTGDWLPLSESDKARQVRKAESVRQGMRKMNADTSAVLQMLTSIMK